MLYYVKQPHGRGVLTTADVEYNTQVIRPRYIPTAGNIAPIHGVRLFAQGLCVKRWRGKR